MPVRAVIYTRFSPRPDAEESESCEKQRTICLEYAERKGWAHDPAKDYFEDRNKSGDDEHRPGLWDAIDSLKRGNVLLVRWRNRLARSVYLTEIINRAVNNARAKIVAAEEGNNGDTAQDEMIRGIFAVLAQYNKRCIQARTSAAMRRHQREGRIMGSQCPYGYRRDYARPGQMVEDAHEQEVVKQILELDTEGLSLRQIAAELDSMGYLPRSGGEWSFKTISKILGRERLPHRASSQ